MDVIITIFCDTPLFIKTSTPRAHNRVPPNQHNQNNNSLFHTALKRSPTNNRQKAFLYDSVLKDNRIDAFFTIFWQSVPIDRSHCYKCCDQAMAHFMTLQKGTGDGEGAVSMVRVAIQVQMWREVHSRVWSNGFTKKNQLLEPSM